MSDPHSLHHIALKSQEQDMGQSPQSPLLLRHSDSTPAHITEAQDIQTVITNIRHNTATEKLNYISYRKQITKTQHKLQCDSALNHEYSVSLYLSTVKDDKLRKMLMMYRLSEHRLDIETGRHRHTQLVSQRGWCVLTLQSGSCRDPATLNPVH